MPLRPIVSCCNTIFAEITKECSRILDPLVGKTPHHIRDSVDLVNKLKDKCIPPNFSLCSFDLKDMYTNIPQGKTLQLTKQLLENDNELGKRTPIKPEDIVSLIKLDLELAYFRWNDEYYKQVKGFGMGKSTSSPLSDI